MFDIFVEFLIQQAIYVHGEDLEQVISLLPSATMRVHFIVEVFLSNGNILLVYPGQIRVWCNNFKYLNFTELHCFFRNLYYWISILNPFANIPTHKNRVLFRPFVKPAVRVKAKSIKLRTYIYIYIEKSSIYDPYYTLNKAKYRKTIDTV